MQALIKELIEKTGLSEDKARLAATTAINFIKTKLPPGIADKLEGFIGGNVDASSLTGGAVGSEDLSGGLDKLKNPFGG